MHDPLQNRVLPNGTIMARAERGTFMGNRGGRLHTADKRVVRSYASRRWIICVLQFKGRHRTVMGDSYTELFFLDEPTALAAGHRPCFECRRAAALAFAAAWSPKTPARADEMDRVLHDQRRAAARSGVAHMLPTGAMFEGDDAMWLVHGRDAYRWSASGYHDTRPLTAFDEVKILTSEGTCSVLANGYRPEWHPSLITFTGGAA